CGRVSQAGRTATSSSGKKLRRAAAASSASRPVAVTTTTGRSGAPSPVMAATRAARTPRGMLTVRSPPCSAAATAWANAGSVRSGGMSPVSRMGPRWMGSTAAPHPVQGRGTRQSYVRAPTRSRRAGRCPPRAHRPPREPSRARTVPPAADVRGDLRHTEAMARYVELHPKDPQPRRLAQVTDVLRDGGLIAYPTDSGYALGARLGSKDAIDRIRTIRRLDDKHHFTLMCATLAQAGTFVILDNRNFRLVKSLTPGPYTFIV